MILDGRLFLAKPDSLTLAAAASGMLQAFEARFGPRCKAMQDGRDAVLLGFDFSADGSPPPYLFFPASGGVVIRLSNGSLSSMASAVYELAHEIAHFCLGSRQQDSTVLTEGLCVVFAEDYTRSVGFDVPDIASTGYDVARDMVRQSLRAGRHDVISRLRQRQPIGDLITADMIASAVPKIGPDLAAKLASPFSSLLTETEESTDGAVASE